MAKPHILTLRVMESSLPGEGIAQLPPDAFRLLRIVQGSRIVVTSVREETVELVARKDPIHTEDGIRMRRADIKRLRVRDGDGVVVQRARHGKR